MKNMLVRPDATVLRRGDGEVQIGTDPRWAVRLSGLNPEHIAWLGALTAGMAPPIPPAAATDAMAALMEAMVLVPRPVRLRTPVRAPADGASDIPVLSAVRPDAAGARTLETRARQVVAISGLGRLGALLAATIAVAGVGEIVLDDRHAVRDIDVGPGGYTRADIGTARDAAVRRMIAQRSPSVVTDGPGTPDVVVLVEDRASDPNRTLGLMGAGVPHLSVVIREADVLVGPFVVPGRTPCLRCLDLHRTDADPAWPMLADQLRRMGPLAQETVLAATGASITAGQVLAALDGAMPRSAAACIEIPAPDAMPRLSATAVHPACGCGASSRRT